MLSIDERQCTVMYGTAKNLCLGYRVSRKLVQTFSFSRKLPNSPCYTERNSNLCKKSHVIKLLRAFCSCPTYTYFHENLWEHIFLTAFAKIFIDFCKLFLLIYFCKNEHFVLIPRVIMCDLYAILHLLSKLSTRL